MRAKGGLLNYLTVAIPTGCATLWCNWQRALRLLKMPVRLMNGMGFFKLGITLLAICSGSKIGQSTVRTFEVVHLW